MRRLSGCLALAAIAALVASGASAQGSRKDDIVFGPEGHPIAGATITVCQPTATGTPCSPLAALFTDATLSVPSQNPFQSERRLVLSALEGPALLTFSIARQTASAKPLQ